jgi:Uma2 family endonuclease
MTTKTQATIDDLYRVPDNGKAEIVDGKLVRMSPTGGMPGRAGSNILLSLREYEKRHGGGHALPDNVGFIVDLPNRKSFSPDVAFFRGDLSMNFAEGAPIFAVEIRSKDEYGRRAEEKMARKRADYFAAGTLIVWDVDLLHDDVVRVFRSSDPQNPTMYRRGQVAEAEPAVQGWTMPVDAIFD